MASSPETHTTLDEYQRVARGTDKYVADDEKGLLVSLLGIAGESGQLLTGYKKRIRDGAAYSKFQSQIREELGDVLWYVANIASRLGLNLSDVAAHNLRKTRGRWLQGEAPSPQFFDEDEDWPEAQQLPRSFRFQYSTVRADGRSRVVLADVDDPSKLLGNPLTDNAYTDDGYRFHDVIHLAFAVHLGWSPVVRSMLKRKRKNDGSPARLVGVRRSRTQHKGRGFEGWARVSDEQVERARSEGEPGGSYANQKAHRPCAPRLYSMSCLV